MTKVGDIRLFLLTTGQEIVAEVTSTGDGDYFELKNIVMVGFMPRQSPSEQPMVGMAPWIPYRDTTEDVLIFREHIITDMAPATEMLNQYQKQFSKVITPTSLIIPR